MLPDALKEALQKLLGERVRFAASLKPYTSMRVGGEAAALTTPTDRHEVAQIVRLCRLHQTHFRVIGGGTNLIVPDSGYPGVVLSTTQSMNQYRFEVEPSQTTPATTLLYSDAGVRVSRLLTACADQGLTGFEFAAGIPGTFGGVLWMNAGTRGGSVEKIFHSMEVVDAEGDQLTLGRNVVAYRYRSSNLPQGFAILGGRVRLTAGDPAAIRAEITRVKAWRANQPLEWPNSGSIFKNPPGDFAGRLIEACGLKGHRIGGAMISDKHANFIINVDQAKADDVLSLIRFVQETVARQHGIKLKTEVEVLS